MKNYDKNIKEIDLALEGILGKIGSALKGMGKGLTRQSWTDADKEGPMKGWHVQFVARKHFGVER